MKQHTLPQRRSDFPKAEFLKMLFDETVRAAALESLPRGGKEAVFTEDTAVICSVWLLLDPLRLEARGAVECEIEGTKAPPAKRTPPLSPRVRYFTAHSHAGEPITPSPDDLLRYYILDEEHGAGVNYIVDRFRAIRIGEETDE